MNQQLMAVLLALRNQPVVTWEQLCTNTPCTLATGHDLITCSCCPLGQVPRHHRKYGAKPRYMHFIEDTLEVVWTES